MPKQYTVGDTSTISGTVNTDLTGATVRVHIRRPEGGTVIDQPAVVTDAVTGSWSYQWTDGDLDMPGLWTMEVEVKYANGSKQTFGPAEFPVRNQIA